MTNILYCSYSYHTQRFNIQQKSGIPFYLLRLQTEGRCEASVNGIKFDIEPGHLLLLKPGDSYELSIEEKQNDLKGPLISSGDYYLICEGDWIAEWWNRSPKPPVSRIELDDQLLALWRQIIVEQRRTSLGGNGELTGYLLRVLCLFLERSYKETAPSSGRPYRATRMQRYIEEHATTTFMVEDVARHVSLSVSRSVHLFKSTFGKSMIEYAHEIRLSAAMERMKYTSMTLDQIAESCGFGAYPYFYKIFKKKYGVSPGAYRILEENV
ncbi:helix-turn-helix transcriptional regulator [Paenibacillus prosopidis]|uniref:AraC family transcriptional regulator n=1 Tax=Paenibacillus prosopidis TaxID=630520 RepID=A0A368W4R2_9BACL|nr:AraC family transcriptional regulator [Paenibacillus prosopidis]RCW48558.1 AraC family transcriptional regulator [Paenibacillus prosopidis]